MTELVLVLLPGTGSYELLLPVVVNVIDPGLDGVKLVVQLIVAPLAKLATGLLGVQTILTPVASLGTPDTEQLALIALATPKLVQLLVTVTGVPTVTLMDASDVEAMSAVAEGTFTEQLAPHEPIAELVTVLLILSCASGASTVTVKLTVLELPPATVTLCVQLVPATVHGLAVLQPSPVPL